MSTRTSGMAAKVRADHSGRASDERRSRGCEVLIALALALFTLWWFLPATGGEFLHWDDGVNVVGNDHLRLPFVDFLGWAFSDVEYVLRYKPINWLIWYGLYHAAGEEPTLFHVQNLVAHAVASGLLFLWLTRLASTVVPRGRFLDTGAIIAAVWWSLHPARTEAVAWVSGFGYPLSTCGYLAALLIYTREGGMWGQPQFRVWGSALVCFGLSLLAYPAPVAGAATFLLLDLVANSAGRPLPAARERIVLHGAFFTLAGALCVMTLAGRSAETELWPDVATLARVGPLDRIGQALLSLEALGRKESLPLDLHVVYSDFADARVDPASVARAALFALFLLGMVAALRRRLPLVAAGVACFVVTVLPFLGWTEHLHYPSDRYSYLPSLGLAVAALGLFAGLATAGPVWRHSILGLAAIGLAVSAGSARARIADWRNNRALVAATIRAPLPDVRKGELGERWVGVFAIHGQMDEALAAADDFLAAVPEDERLLYQRGILQVRQGEYLLAERDLQAAWQSNPGRDGLAITLAYIATQTGRWGDVQKFARAQLERVPGDPLAQVLLVYGQARGGQMEQAIGAASELAAADVHPETEKWWRTLAAFFETEGRDDAAAQLRRLLDTTSEDGA